MRTAADVVLALEAVGGRLEKEAIVRQAWNAGITDFFQGAVMAYSAFITFGVKKVPLIQAEDDGEPSKWQWQISKLWHKILNSASLLDMLLVMRSKMLLRLHQYANGTDFTAVCCCKISSVG